MPDVNLAYVKRFFYREPFDFVDYKRLKKAVFRRLLFQKARMVKTYRKYNAKGPSFLNPARTTASLFPYLSPYYAFKPQTYQTSSFQRRQIYDLPFGLVRLFYTNESGSALGTALFIKKTRFKPGYPRI